jgi:hypothetical protein
MEVLFVHGAFVRDGAWWADMDEAVKLVSGTPCAVAHGVVEVWPLNMSGQVFSRA